MGGKEDKFTLFSQISAFLGLPICCKTVIKTYTDIKNKRIVPKKSVWASLRRAASSPFEPFALEEGSFLLVHDVVADPVHAVLPG